MATGTVNPALLLSGPGLLWWAPLGTTEPSHTPVAGLFPETAWGTGWVALGSTDEGSTFSDSIDTEDMTVAESNYPVRVVTTGRTATWSTMLAEINTTNLKAALNGPVPVVTGTAGTTLTRISPPDVGDETRAMIGWQSEDNSVRFVGYQVLQVGELSIPFKKGADKATLSIEWRLEKPVGVPYNLYLAGTGRAA